MTHDRYQGTSAPLGNAQNTGKIPDLLHAGAFSKIVHGPLHRDIHRDQAGDLVKFADDEGVASKQKLEFPETFREGVLQGIARTQGTGED